MQVTAVSAYYDNYIWMIITGQQVYCVDPGEAGPVLKFLENEELTLDAILLTHHHHDHIDGTDELLRAYPHLSVYGPKDSRIPMVTHTLQDGDLLPLESCEFKIMATPGHTSTHISYYESRHHWLFCGDTLFSAGCGRVFDGTIEELKASLDKLKNLPEETQVFCAHEYTQKNLRFAATVEPDNMAIRNYAHRLLAKEKRCSLPSSIAIEKQVNPFLRTETAAAQAYAQHKGCKDTEPLSVFKLIRAEKDVF
jgi:hydroxyacylglutathione hydrolase